MRNYWIRILVGAFCIFAVGMIGVTLVRHGAAKVHNVVSGTGPISLPLAFIPFEIGGNKLGTLSHVVVERTAPKQISAVRVTVDMNDSLVAQGLTGCRLAANFDTSHDRSREIQIKTSEKRGGTFRCLGRGDSDTSVTEFGQAVLQPGDVVLPLLLPNDLVDELRSGSFLKDSAEAHEIADSVIESIEAVRDSIQDAEESKMDSLNAQMDSMQARHGRMTDSLRAEGRRRVDSLKQAALRLADSAKRASLKDNASRPR
jgi:hypothetical protein